MKTNAQDRFVSLDDDALDDVVGSGLLGGDNSFALIDLSGLNLLDLGNLGLLGDSSSSSTSTSTTNQPGGLLGLGFLGL